MDLILMIPPSSMQTRGKFTFTRWEANWGHGGHDGVERREQVSHGTVSSAHPKSKSHSFGTHVTKQPVGGLEFLDQGMKALDFKPGTF